MKNSILIVISCVCLFSCHDLDLYPLSEGSTESWYSTEKELIMSINDLYRDEFWPLKLANGSGPDSWSDDWLNRVNLNPITNGTITSEWSVANTEYWLNTYKAIARCNAIISNIERSASSIVESQLILYEAEVRYIRACQYARLIFFFGDVVFYMEPFDIEEAFKQGRSSKEIVLQAIYEDFDFASKYLPERYATSAIQRATKGAAYGMKARAALYQGDYQTAKDAAKACMDLGIYQLHPDFSSLFLTSTKISDEYVFSMPRSIEYGQTWPSQNTVTRNPTGGWAGFTPSWDIFCSFLCTDGLPIDESTLFDPHNPFQNRDPRCAATIVEFGTPHLGFIYQPHADSLEVLNLTTGRMQANKDTRSVDQYASYNGLAFRKGVDNTWLHSSWTIEPTKIILRYADVLLMYAEAKIELNEIDQTVFDAMNQVRSRAYGANISQTDKYPVITETNVSKLRRILRTERRMEFVLEGRRYMDIIRWKLAEKVLNLPNYGMLYPVEYLREKIIKPGLWFFPETPPIDEDGIADFSGMHDKGLIQILTLRIFDKNRQYLWPIPAKDILINDNLTQNPNY